MPDTILFQCIHAREGAESEHDIYNIALLHLSLKNSGHGQAQTY